MFVEEHALYYAHIGPRQLFKGVEAETGIFDEDRCFDLRCSLLSPRAKWNDWLLLCDHTASAARRHLSREISSMDPWISVRSSA